MEFIVNRQPRKSYERSISERNFESYRSLDEHQKFLKIKDHHLLSQDSSHFDTMARDLRVNKNETNHTIKEEILPPPPRRYFCIFCKMDFLSADDFLEHLELHPNGSFVLVKRDFPPPPVSEPCIESEEPSSPILPEIIQNQIKIEPISEDEEDEFPSSPYQAIDPALSEANEEIVNNSHETQDPNHQLVLLSNPRIGDGPGDYLCNVCNAKFVYKNNLKSHLKRHLGIYPYVCFCGKRYQLKCKLNKHIEQAHAKIKNFKCPVPTCPKKYFTRNDLAFHISVTHQERQEIPCHICKKVFNSQKSLQIHGRKYHRVNQES